ncbi:MAG: 2-dehydro-3-deoxyphosphogluconate aldolase [Phycisphaerae bacterium]|nr:2-dehydro-3-deoxyphosphogluconate aldolase [Phycisphaerae bacterium]
MERATVREHLERIGGIAVVRAKDPGAVMPIASALAVGGIGAIEVTMTVPGALDVIRSLAREMGGVITLGVGSVTDPDTASAAVDAGATFVVSPVFRPEVVKATHSSGAVAVAGAFTPTEALAAHESGAEFVKVFPADVLGMAFIKGVLAPMPQLRLVPTGGVTPENAGEWIRAGCVAVGVGSALLDKKAIAAGEYGVLTEKARVMRASIDAAREGSA